MLIRLSPVIFLVLIAAWGQDSAEAPTPAATPAASAAPAAPAGPKPAPAGAEAYIISPADGAVVSSPVTVVFGLRGIGVAPAGVPRTDAGHHHLLVDTGLPTPGVAIPSDLSHRHFGGGQTEAAIELEAGTHTLQLLLGDEGHIPHEPPITSEQITIEVR
jgi:hypothetical protein